MNRPTCWFRTCRTDSNGISMAIRKPYNLLLNHWQQYLMCRGGELCYPLPDAVSSCRIRWQQAWSLCTGRVPCTTVRTVAVTPSKASESSVSFYQCMNIKWIKLNWITYRTALGPKSLAREITIGGASPPYYQQRLAKCCMNLTDISMVHRTGLVVFVQAV